MGFGLRRPGTKQAQSTNPADVAGVASKAVKANNVKKVKLSIKMKGK
jgi:hypothetical protein